MNTIIIPKSILKNDDLVIIPRKEYDLFLEFKKIIPIIKATKKKPLFLSVARRR